MPTPLAFGQESNRHFSGVGHKKAGQKHSAASNPWESKALTAEPGRQIVIPQDQTSKPKEHKKPCDNPADRNEDDTCSQWRSANAAQDAITVANTQADYAYWGLWVGAIAAFATAYAAIEAGRAAKAAAASNTIARETAKRELRAYINVAQVRVDGLEGNARFCLEYKNCGQTPAYDIRGWNGLELRDAERIKTFESTGNDAGLGVLGPGNSAYFIKPAPRRLVMKEFDMLRAGDAAIYLWGEISYRDIFGERHTTRFRYFIGGRHGVQPDRRMEYCDDGNEAD